MPLLKTKSSFRGHTTAADEVHALAAPVMTPVQSGRRNVRIAFQLVKLGLTGSSVEREQSERLTASAPESTEMARVRAQEVERSVTVGENDDRRVRQSNPKIGVPLHDSLGVAEILGREELELVRPARDLVDEGHLRLVANSTSNQVVQLRENKG